MTPFVSLLITFIALLFTIAGVVIPISMYIQDRIEKRTNDYNRLNSIMDNVNSYTYDRFSYVIEMYRTHHTMEHEEVVNIFNNVLDKIETADNEIKDVLKNINTRLKPRWCDKKNMDIANGMVHILESIMGATTYCETCSFIDGPNYMNPNDEDRRVKQHLFQAGVMFLTANYNFYGDLGSILNIIEIYKMWKKYSFQVLLGTTNTYKDIYICENYNSSAIIAGRLISPIKWELHNKVTITIGVEDVSDVVLLDTIKNYVCIDINGITYDRCRIQGVIPVSCKQGNIYNVIITIGGEQVLLDRRQCSFAHMEERIHR